ncbi:hypothetical protein OsI_22004 [Oryza sativa Indica Group]|uniref:Uncharacterized protein n=1 Tax=Oryza sativa subsp. indica TaxID=39946 RepID=B8B3N5_ORYSI|nr:hypothetical protein OsI_22004 [Oryza sativa Indica Group]
MANDNAPQCGKCSRMMENYDHTNSNSRDCTCDKCHFLLAGYSCLQIHDPQANATVTTDAFPADTLSTRSAPRVLFATK